MFCNYASRGHLRTDIKIHSFQKPNQCKCCDYSSITTSNLASDKGCLLVPILQIFNIVQKGVGGGGGQTHIQNKSCLVKAENKLSLFMDFFFYENLLNLKLKTQKVGFLRHKAGFKT